MLIKDGKAPWWKLEEYKYGLCSHFGIASHEKSDKLIYLEQTDLKSDSLKQAKNYFITFYAGAL